jgi:hypothetical protein
VGEEVWRLLGFVALMCCSEGCLCQGLQGLEVCIVGTVGLSVGGESVGGRGSVVTGWEG